MKDMIEDLPFVGEIDITTCSQAELETQFSKYQLMGALHREFLNAGVSTALEKQGIPSMFGVDFLSQMVLRKRASIPVLVGILKKHFINEASVDNPAQECADMILKMIENDWANWIDMSQQVVLIYDIDDQVKAKLDVFQYPLPMIEEPEEVTHNRQTGYQTIRGSLILRDNHHDEDICLDHINRVNSIPLSINADVVAFVRNQWKNLDKPKEHETFVEYQKRVRAFERYDQVSRDVIHALQVQGNRFWLTHKYDKRGRTYCVGYHVSYQAADWNKACILFAEAECLNSN